MLHVSTFPAMTQAAASIVTRQTIPNTQARFVVPTAWLTSNASATRPARKTRGCGRRFDLPAMHFSGLLKKSQAPADVWTSQIRHTFVLLIEPSIWQENFSPHNTMTTNKFQHAGLDWIPHTPGDPMPCPPDTRVRVLFADFDCYGDEVPAKALRWDTLKSSGDIIGWHPIEEQPSLARRVLDLLEAGDIEQVKHELRKELE